MSKATVRGAQHLGLPDSKLALAQGNSPRPSAYCPLARGQQCAATNTAGLHDFILRYRINRISGALLLAFACFDYNLVLQRPSIETIRYQRNGS